MGLVVTNNVTSLQAQHNLSRTSVNLSKSLERLSSGLKINRGADAPAGLVISEQQRAQIAGLQTAIDNTSKAVSMVQTAEGALTEINGLLTKIRGLALDSANTAVNDSNTLAANQAEVTNALASINRIANNTQFGSRGLLNGESGVIGTISGPNANGIGNIKGGTDLSTGTYVVAVTAGAGGRVEGAVAGAGSMALAGSVAIGGGGLSSTLTVDLALGDTVLSAATKIQTALDTADLIGGGRGKFTVTTPGNVLTIRSNMLGTTSTIMTAVGNIAATNVVLGTAAVVAAAGVNLVSTVTEGAFAGATGISAGSQGLNNQVTYRGSEGLSFAVAVVNGDVDLTGPTTINATDNGLIFQIGANAQQTVEVSVEKATADRLGTGISGLLTTAANLGQVDITTANGAQDAIQIVDKAINDVTTLRGKLGAVQSQALESTANNLRATLENTIAAESVIRDTDFAAETSNFIKQQIMLQAGVSVLSNANMMSQQVLGLLQT